MAKKKDTVTGEDKIDPTLPFEEIEIDGRVLKMCLNYRAMALAERKFRQQGHNDVLLLVAAPNPAEVLNLQFLFACSLYHFQPEIPYDEAMDMVTPQNGVAVFTVLLKVLEASLVKVDSPHPPQPAQ